MRYEPGSPEDWLRYARADTAIAKIALPEDALYEQLCFHCQQAVEKCLKAVLVKLGVVFPKTHSIEHLIDLLPLSVSRTPELVAAAQLTIYATLSRYPTDEEPVTASEYLEALRIAEPILTWAEYQVNS